MATGQALRELARRLSSPGIVIVLSDFLAAHACEGLRSLGAARHQVLAVQVLSRDELAPDLDGDLRLVDSETGADVIVSVTPKLRQLYAETLRSIQAELAETCARMSADWVAVRSDDALQDTLFRVLKPRGILE